MSPPTLLFATEAYCELQRLIASDRVQQGVIERDSFPDGERYLRLVTPVRGRRVAVLGGTIDDTATLELFDLASAAVVEGASAVTLLIPYFGYSTMERQQKPGEVVTAKLRAHLISALARPADGLQVVLLDLHAPGLPYYFEADVRPVHITPTRLLCEAIRNCAGDEDFVVGAVDAGAAKRVQNLANELGVEAGFVFKRRLSGDQVSFTALAADVRGKRVVLCDDMVRTGGSLIQGARAYLEAGATSVAAVATHGVLPPGALDRLERSGVLDCLVVTDSHPNALAQRGGFLRVVTIAGVLERWLQRDQEKEP
mgnify:CR=1 FL=1